MKSLNRWLFLFALLSVFCAGQVYAGAGNQTLVSPEVLALQVDPAQPTAAAGTPSAATTTVSDPATLGKNDDGADPTVGEVADAGKQVYDDWTRLGWMAGVSALCGFLLMILRLKKLDDWLTNKDWKKWKPWVSAFIGAIGGFFGYLILPDMTWANWPQAVAAGVMAGLAIVGVHQGITGGNTKQGG